MTRRERLEAKVVKRAEWAGKAEARSDARFGAARTLADSIPLGQPILVGHHSEGHARRDVERIDSNMRKGCEEADLAKHHTQAASGLAHQLDRSIFSDDADAVEALEARIAELEAQRDVQKRLGAAWKKAGRPAADNTAGWATIATILRTSPESLVDARCDCASEDRFLHRGPVPGYVLSNLGANIRRLKGRIEEIKVRAERTATAEAAPGGVVIEGDEYVRVTFAEKPERAIICALKSAGFSWSGGSWCGYRERIPAEVASMVLRASPAESPEGEDAAQDEAAVTVGPRQVGPCESCGGNPCMEGCRP